MCSISKTFSEATREFGDHDPEMMAKLGCADYDPQLKKFRLYYLNHFYQISFPEGIISTKDNGYSLTIEEKALILLYLSQATGEPLANKWLSFSELPYGMMHDIAFKSVAIKPIAEYYAEKPDKLLQAAQLLGGSELGIGNLGANIPVFPRIHVGIILWLGDENFPAKANMVFDAIAPKYLTTAELYVLGSVISKRLIQQNEYEFR